MKLIRSAQSIRILALMAVLTVLFSNCNQEGYRTNSVLPPENGHANQDDSSLTDPTQNPTPDNTGNSGNTGNSNNNPFGNGDATTTFDVHPESSLTSGLNDSYHLKVLMDINTTDLSMSGAFFH